MTALAIDRKWLLPPPNISVDPVAHELLSALSRNDTTKLLLSNKMEV